MRKVPKERMTGAAAAWGRAGGTLGILSVFGLVVHMVAVRIRQTAASESGELFAPVGMVKIASEHAFNILGACCLFCVFFAMKLHQEMNSRRTAAGSELTRTLRH
jgi:hypothetical protein